MSSINDIIKQLEDIAANPKKAVTDYEKATGKKAIGCFPPYAPEEIVHAAGLLPVGLWGAQVELNNVRAVFPAFCCSVIQAVKELELKGEYDILAGVIVPSDCDTLKALGQKWTRKEIPCLQFVHPHNRKLDAARVFLRGEYQYIREGIEKITGEKITDDALAKSIAVYNEHRKVMREFSEVAGKYPDLIDPIARHTVFKSAYFIRKEAHTEIVKKLIENLKNEPQKPWKGTKVVVSGIMLEPVEVLETFRDLGIAIVADDLAHESRQNRVDAAETGDALDSLAGIWQNMYGCSLAYEEEKTRIPMLRELKEKSGADAIVIAMMKFCDPEEFDYPLIKKDLEGRNIPHLHIEIDQQMQSVEQIRTRLQAFTEIVSQTKSA